MPENIITTLLENGVIAFLFAATLWWVAIRYERLLGSLRDMVALNNLFILGLQKELLSHDLTVSGLNPSAGDNDEMRTNKAYLKYTELVEIFHRIEECTKKIAEKR